MECMAQGNMRAQNVQKMRRIKNVSRAPSHLRSMKKNVPVYYRDILQTLDSSPATAQHSTVQLVFYKASKIESPTCLLPKILMFTKVINIQANSLINIGICGTPVLLDANRFSHECSGR